jgi:hypothetical protein
MMIAAALNNGVSEEVLFWVALKAGFAFNSATLFLYYRDVLSGAAQLLLSAGGGSVVQERASMAKELQEQLADLQQKVATDRSRGIGKVCSGGSSCDMSSSSSMEAMSCVSLKGCMDSGSSSGSEQAPVLPLGEASWEDIIAHKDAAVRIRGEAMLDMQRAFANKQPGLSREEAEAAARYRAQLDIPGAVKGRVLRLAQTGVVAELQARVIQMQGYKRLVIASEPVASF